MALAEIRICCHPDKASSELYLDLNSFQFARLKFTSLLLHMYLRLALISQLYVEKRVRPTWMLQ